MLEMDGSQIGGGADALNQLMLISLLNECNRKKRGREGLISSSSDTDDPDYVQPLSADDAADDGGADAKVKKGRAKTTKAATKATRASRSAAYRALAKLRGGDIDEDETRYLRKLSREECSQIKEAARRIARKVRRHKPLLFRVLEWPVPDRTKARVCQRLTRFEAMEPGEGEHAKLSAWISGVEALPIGNHVRLPVDIQTDPPEKVSAFLRDARKTLDGAVFGHASAKEEIVRLCAQWIRNPTAPTQALAIQGPMGNGKTTLVKNGISKVMHRPFAFLALGGAQDSSFLHGFDYTYEGARPGRIAEALKTAGCMNPVIFLDELDKLSDTPRGREIQQTLVHLLDGSQNQHFRDRYFDGIDLDLSRAVFVVSFNDPSKIDRILLDRMRVVVTKGFSVDDKLKIARQFILPEVIKDIGLTDQDVSIDDDALRRVILHYTNREEGVRTLRRCVHQICSEVNLQRLLGKSGAEAAATTAVTTDNVDGYVKTLRQGQDRGAAAQMYM